MNVLQGRGCSDLDLRGPDRTWLIRGVRSGVALPSNSEHTYNILNFMEIQTSPIHWLDSNPGLNFRLDSGIAIALHHRWNLVER